MSIFRKVLKPRQLCDLELLLDGSFSPLEGFLNQADYHSVLETMRLENGALWPIPVNLAFTEAEICQLKAADQVLLVNSQGLDIAELNVEDIYLPDLSTEAIKVFGLDDDNHPFVQILRARHGHYYVGGKVRKINDVPHLDFQQIRNTPAQIRQRFAQRGWDKVVAFQTRNPMHKSHFHLTLNALEEAGEGAKLLLHPVVGITQDVDINYDLRVRCYQKLLSYYPEGSVELSLLPLSMRMAGPREALWHAIIRKNYGVTHFIVGRDHAGPSFKTKQGNDFFGPYDAQHLLAQHADEIGITLLKSRRIVYAACEKRYVTEDEIHPDMNVLNISGTEQRALLKAGKPLHEWFTFPDIMEELQREFAA